MTRYERLALDLAEQYVKVDPFYREKTLTPRERALMALAIRCYTEPVLTVTEVQRLGEKK